MKKREKNKYKAIIAVVSILVVVVAVIFFLNLYGSDGAIAGQAVNLAGKIKPNPIYKSNFDLKNVYSCTEVDAGVTIKQTRSSPRESKSNICMDPIKALKYSCEGRKVGEMKYKSSELACTGDSWCEGGVCRSCALGQTRCGSSCVDLQTDFWDCGRCGAFCRVAGPSPDDPKAESCVEGQCVQERKVLVCNIDWLSDDYADASPIPESQIDNIFERVNEHLLSDFPEQTIKLTYEVYDPQRAGKSGLSVPDYIIDVPGEVVPYCGVNNLKDFDYVVYPYYSDLRLIYDATDDGRSKFGLFSSQLRNTWGIAITDSNWQNEATQLEQSVIALINDNY